MQWQNVKLETDPATGTIILKYRDQSIIKTFSPVLYYNDEWLTERGGQLIFQKVETKSGSLFENNAFFPTFYDLKRIYDVKNAEEHFTLEFHLIIFPEHQTLYFTADLIGNKTKSNQIGGMIDLGIPESISAYRFYHGSERKQQLDTTPGTGISLFNATQSAWQEPCILDHLPTNEALKISYILGKLPKGCAAFVPVNRYGQHTIIHCCQFLDIPLGLKFVSGDYLQNSQYSHLAGGLLTFGEDPAILTQDVFKIYMNLIGRPHALRWYKEFPPIFEDLGFCTWNTFYRAVDMEGIQQLAVENFTIKSGSDRFKYLIVDDGWQSINGLDINKDPPMEPILVPEGLRNFEANFKFPNGIKQVVEVLKNQYGFKALGLWHAVTGYWPGVEPNSPIGHQYNIIKRGRNAYPDPDQLRGYGFWVDYYKFLRSVGIDFLKIDNQCSLTNVMQGQIPLDYALENHYLMQQGAAYSQNLQILNCMCMPPDCKIHWTKSNVSRVSDDFYPGKPELARHQIIQCTYNSLWYSVFCWPDYDMFQTNSPKWNPLILLHMVSGGPIYIADELGETNRDIVERLSFPDGRLPRLDRPAIPTDDIIFGDPSKDSLCKMWNYHDLPGWGRIYYYYFANMTESPESRTAILQVSDFGGFRLERLDDEHIQKFPIEFVVKDQDSSFTTTIRAADGSINIKINHMEAKYFSFHPIQRDVTLIGLADIYNGSKGIAYVEWCGQTALMVTMVYQGNLIVYKRTEGIVSATTAEGTPLIVERNPDNPRLFNIQVPKGAVVLRWI